MSINVLLTLVEQYKEAAQLIEAAQAEQEQLKLQIREALAEHHLTSPEKKPHTAPTDQS